MAREKIGEVLERNAMQIEANARQDAIEPVIQEIVQVIGALKLAVEGIWSERQNASFVTKIAGDVDRHETDGLSRQWKTVLGVDPLFARETMRPTIEQFAARNLRLIKSVPDELLSQIEAELVQAMRSGARATTFEAIVSDRLRVSEKRARLIARDQIASLNGEATRVRQRELGVTRYIWSTAQDERVVGNPSGLYPRASSPSTHGDHWEREGQIFSWDAPPPDGHPGQPINCRCVARAVIEDVL